MQETVRHFVAAHGLACGAEHRYMDLTSEIGELGKEILKATDFGQKPFTLQDGCREEMGDCLFSLLALCCEMGLDAGKALEAAIEKYRARLARYGRVDSQK